jgi:hypothetical protein
MAHWPRDPAFLAEANRLLSLSASDLVDDEAWLAEDDGAPIGYYRLSLHAGPATIRSRACVSSSEPGPRQRICRKKARRSSTNRCGSSMAGK